MAAVTRRALLQSSVAGVAVMGLSSFASNSDSPGPARKGRIHQSVSRWCYKDIPLEQLAGYAASIGLVGVDLLQLDEYEVPRRFGLICTMGYAGGGEIPDALNRTENHAAIEQAFRVNIPRAAAAHVPNVITFSGNRRGMSDEQGAANCIAGLNRVKHIAEDHGVTICMELLNSKVTHPDYMCDHTAWGVQVVKEVNSPNGVPGRHELNNTQEVQWDGVMRAIADSGFRGYVAHEFVPTGDPLVSLRQAADLCDV
jgi:hydroxypyruvate isomerase